MTHKMYREYIKIWGKLKRREISGESFPLYRLIIAAAVLSGIIQLVTWTPPGSVEQTGAWWTDLIFMIAQPLGGIIVGFSMHMRHDTGLRVQVERIGNLFLAFACLFYFFSVAVNNGSIPVTFGTWCNLAVGVYLVVRILEDTAVAAEATKINKKEGSR